MSNKLYKFQAEWCGPCKMLTQMLDQMDIPLDVRVIDVDESPELAKQYNIRGIPALIIVDDNGNPIKTKVGVPTIQGLKDFLGV